MKDFSTGAFKTLDTLGDKAGRVVRSKGFRIAGIVVAVAGILLFGWMVFVRSFLDSARGRKSV